ICDIVPSPVCSSETFDAEAPDLDVNGYVQICNNESYLMHEVAFYYVKIQDPGTFTFLIHKPPYFDYDFAVWQNPDCQNLGMADRASFLADNYFNIPVTGLALDEEGTCESAGYGEGNIYQPGVVRHLDVQVDDEIIIMVYMPPQATSEDFSISFGGSAILDCTIVGNSYGKCDVDENDTEQFDLADILPDLEEDYPGNNFQFYDNQTNAEDEIGPQISFPLNVNYNAGNPTEIFVRVEDNSGELVRVLQIFLYVNRPPQLLIDEVSLPVQCDDDGDGEAVFNLVTTESNFVNDPSLYTFKYYETEADA